MKTFGDSKGFSRKKKRLGDLLVDAGVITNEQLMQALEYQKQSKDRLGVALVRLNFTSESEIAEALRSQLKLDFINLSSIKIDNEILRLIPDSSILKRYTMMPFAFDPKNSRGLLVAMADPMDIIAMDDIGIITNMEISPVIATSNDILASIDRYFGSKEAQAVVEQYNKERESQLGEIAAAEESNGEVDNSPIVVLVKNMIEQAVRQRSSDIHIEPMETRIRVRFRVDGVLSEINSYPVHLLSAIITRIKIIGGMDISERRKPQDGRITQIVDRMEYDIRVSVLPTVFGEKVVMRLTSKNTLMKDKRHLGFSEDELVRFNKILSAPNGIILVTGPTGSGKSTTLYTALSELNRPDVNIVTVEDPVEANVDGINQVQVNPRAELTFAAALRSILRQDPDIIMIGEIRDKETADIAVTASITGHLVVSTLHTNSAASSISRLYDMGVEPYLLADSVVGVIAQRLVRRLCKCKQREIITEMDKVLLEVSEDTDFEIYKPSGCNICNDSGYLGRVGVYEIMSVSSKLRRVIAQGVGADLIMEQALKDGMSTLKMSTARLVREGITSMEEFKRIVYSNEDEN